MFNLYTYLHSKTHGVEHDEKEHQVLKIAGGDDVPHLILVGVLGNVTSQWPGLKSVLYALTLEALTKQQCTNVIIFHKDLLNVVVKSSLEVPMV